MSRAPVTIAILAWNSWETTRDCLESLRPTLGPRDQVVVLDNGSTDATPTRLGHYKWVEVVTNLENRGFAGGCNDAAAAARHDTIIFLNNDTLPAHRWIDPLVAAFENPMVGAAGSRSNFVSGPQVVEGANYSSPSDMRRFARQWADSHRGQASETTRLVGFCLAVRRSLFEQLGGFDEGYGIGGFEDDDLCERIKRAGYRLMICHDSFVHHEGHRTFDANGLNWLEEQESNRERFITSHTGPVDGPNVGAAVGRPPLVSACLIVKDEEENLGDCLRSLEGFADEVVVYDTGSTDGTVELARRLGAKVVEGYWDDDFSRARNASLEQCHGDWIAWLDADETLHTDDIAALRTLLARTKPDVDAWSVRIHNLTGSGVSAEFIHHATRLFRRARCEWTGRLHEQIAQRGTHAAIRQAVLEDAYIHHTGYTDEAMRVRDKAARNLRMAQTEVDRADGWDMGYSLTSLARSLLLAGQLEAAAAKAMEALEQTDNGVTRRLAARTATDAYIQMSRWDEALEGCERMRLEGADPRSVAGHEANVRTLMGEYDEALRLIENLSSDHTDDDGFGLSAGTIASLKTQALAGLERYGDAADALLSGLAEEGVLDSHLGLLVEYMRRGERPLSTLASAIPNDRKTMFLAQVLQLAPDMADDVLEACLDSQLDQKAVLATAAGLGYRLPVDRALVWSIRLRSAGYGTTCPLIRIATSTADPVVRARAAATAKRVFDDERAEPAFLAAWHDADGTGQTAIRMEVSELCPALLTALPVVTPQAPARLRVSIVIPCFNHADLTIKCLQSVQQSTDPGLYEIVVIDNGSSDATQRLSEVQNGRFRVIRNQENTGFGPACNQGAKAASPEADYVCFLNNDTEVQPGWLVPLVAALDEDEKLAAVQPQLLYPDGRLNDAGGLVFQGGTPWNYGKGHRNPDSPQYAGRRAPDYASGACLLVRRQAFEQVGGFDDRYAPAYFEDTDLSFAFRAAGWKVLYEPASKVVHVEGGTAGTDVTTGLKQYQVRNAELFKQKWRDELAGRAPLDPAQVDSWAHRSQGGYGAGEDSPSELEVDKAADSVAAGALRVLVLDPTMPMHDRAAGSLRMFNVLKCLRGAGHAVTFYAAGGGDRRYANDLGRFGITCFGGDPNRQHEEEYRADYFPPLVRLMEQRQFDVVIVSPWSLAESVVPLVRETLPAARLIIDTNDLHFLRLERQAALTGERRDQLQALDTRRRELDMYRQVDAIVAVSDRDAAVITQELPDARVVVVPVVHDLLDPGPDFSSRHGALFVGNFNHKPNGDALYWWQAEIARTVAELAPGLELTVAGNDPQGEAAAMAGPGITVAGYVPSTLPYLHRARISVAPLRYGAGMKGKVGEALAAGLPVVATSIAAEGIGLVDGQHLLVADTPDDFARAVARLHVDHALWTALRDAGRAHMAEHFGLGRMRAGLAELLAQPALAAAAGSR